MGLFSGLSNVIGGIVGARASDKVSDRLAESFTSAGQALEAGGKATEERLLPISSVAPDTMQRLSDIILKGDLSKFYESPDYQYRLTSGRDAIEGGAAASKMLMSGRTLKALEKYRQEQATQEYGNVLNRLSGLFQLTSPYYETYAGMPYTMAGDRANMFTNIGEAKAQGIRGKAAGTMMAIGGIGSMLDAGMGMGGFGGLFGGSNFVGTPTISGYGGARANPMLSFAPSKPSFGG